MDVFDRFQRVAEGDGEHVAVHDGDRDVTYRELAMLARQFAACFAAIASPQVLIAYEQGAYAYAAMLGTMLAGGCYAPVNLSAPRDKIAAIARSFNPDIVVGEPAVLAALEDTVPSARHIALKDIEASARFSAAVSRHALAYVIFTSGSTGAPKGVMISQTALGHYIDWVVESGLFQPSDRTSQYTNIGFDLSVLDIVGALCSGSTLVPFITRSDRLMPAQGIRKHGITVWVSVPSVVSLMLRAKQVTSDHLGSVRQFFFIGEPLLETHVAAIFAARPDAQVWNAYGPTEATVSMTCLKLAADTYATAVRTSVALGDATGTMAVHILGGESLDCGELVIVGPQLAEGYWNAPEQTARAFRDIELGTTRCRAYFSGDWVRRADGHLYFESRVDHQVKIDGFRLELNEVASAIRALGWPEVVVLKIHGEIVAILENKAGVDPAAIDQSLRPHLKLTLDRYAIPTRFLALEAFPRNQNDKIDLVALHTYADQQLRDVQSR